MADEHVDRRDDESEGGPVKTFLEHLEDFRWVLIKSIVALGLAMLICLFAANHIVQIIEWPLTRAPKYYANTSQTVIVDFGTNHLGYFQLTSEQQKLLNCGTNRFISIQIEPLTIGTNQVLGWRVSDDVSAIAGAQRMKIDLVNLSPASGFIIAFQVALYGGAVLAAPFIFYFVMSFVFPALKLRERKYVYRGLFFGIGLFLFGVAFCYFILMRLALAASQMYSNWLGFSVAQWRAEDYISFVCRFLIGMGIGFELPVVILTLVKIGVLNYSMLAKARRYMIVINLTLGAILTTPEIFTMLVMFAPLQLLYEITVWVAWYWGRNERKRALQSAESA